MFQPLPVKELVVAAGSVHEIAFEIPRGGKLTVRGARGSVSLQEANDGVVLALLLGPKAEFTLACVRAGDYVVCAGDWTKNVTIEPGVETTVWVGD